MGNQNSRAVNDLSNSVHRLLIKKTNQIENVLNCGVRHKKHRNASRRLKRLKPKHLAFHGALFARKQNLIQMEAVIEKLQKSNKKLSRNPIIFTKDKKKVIKSAQVDCAVMRFLL